MLKKIIASDTVHDFETITLPDYMNSFSGLLMAVAQKELPLPRPISLTEYLNRTEPDSKKLLSKIPRKLISKVEKINSNAVQITAIVDRINHQDTYNGNYLKKCLLKIVNLVYSDDPTKIIHWTNYIEQHLHKK